LRTSLLILARGCVSRDMRDPNSCTQAPGKMCNGSRRRWCYTNLGVVLNLAVELRRDWSTWFSVAEMYAEETNVEVDVLSNGQQRF
jgi:hypothetical protein